MADITTKSGLALLDRSTAFATDHETARGLVHPLDIAAIEAEARRAERARLAKAVRGLAWDTCGGWGCVQNMGALIRNVLALLEGEG